MHRAINMKTADLILIEEANRSTQTPLASQEVRALVAPYNRGNKRKRPSYQPGTICNGCQELDHIGANCHKVCGYCHEPGHLIDNCFKLKWQNGQRFSNRDDNGNGRSKRSQAGSMP
jgi:hypothetical protein